VARAGDPKPPRAETAEDGAGSRGERVRMMPHACSYLQKLFTEHGSTCSEFIYSVRLDHAARLLTRPASLEARQPLIEIAYACGFRDYTHFARRFRRRFNCSPGTGRGMVALSMERWAPVPTILRDRLTAVPSAPSCRLLATRR
jgi:AraC-like DNA-binding protein